MSHRYVLALDQGTTSSRAIVFDRTGHVVATAQRELSQLYPAPGHVEHDPEDIWSTQLRTAREALVAAGLTWKDVAAIGVTNQRETTLIWDRATGVPVANAVVWQSRVTSPMCERLKADGHEPIIQRKTGLVVDAYFSGTKIAHLLNSIDGLRERAARGEVLFGTVDCFLLWRLTRGRLHVTDVSNASRTMLFNIHTLAWDDELLQLLDIPRAMLPEVRSCSEVYGNTDPEWLGGPVPVAGMAGDQQAALFGQTCFAAGEAKNTYGTGCFMLLNTGSVAVPSAHGLLTTIAWSIGGQTTYALEGSVFIAGAAVQWLRDGLRAIRTSADVEALAAQVPDAGGVFLVPAFVGMGAPYWDPHARGTIVGLTRDSTVAHIARAAVDAMAYQTRDVLEVMRDDAHLALTSLKVDGGAAVNGSLLQFQADLLGVPVRRPTVGETTALGAAYLAGLAVGYWEGQDDIRRNWVLDQEFTPAMSADERERRYARWRKAVGRALDWETP